MTKPDLGVMSISSNKGKRFKRFFGRTGEFFESDSSRTFFLWTFFLAAFVVAAALVVAFFQVPLYSSGFFAAVFAALILLGTFLSNGRVRAVVVWISFCFSSVSLIISVGTFGWMALGGVFLSPFVLGVYLLWKAGKIERGWTGKTRYSSF